MDKKAKKISLIIGIILLVAVLVVFDRLMSKKNYVAKTLTNNIDNIIPNETSTSSFNSATSTTNSSSTPAKITSSTNPSAQELKEYGQNLDDGLNYYTACKLGQKQACQQAIDAFLKAEKIADNKVWVPFLNIGNVYKYQRDFVKAELYYRKALVITNYGESTTYLALIDMYRYDLKKKPAVVKKMYEDAIKTAVSDKASIMASYVGYLDEIGDYKTELTILEALSKAYPKNMTYIQAIADLKAKIK